MNFRTTKLREAICSALVLGTSSLAATSVAFAQSETQTLEKIEVTGSRIKRVDIETSQPVFSVSREDIQAQGLTSIGDVIQNLTSQGSSLNTAYNNGGNGETRVSLRGLGSERTLVLVNGRRWVGGTGLGGAVDLNTIPTAAVERIEVLKDGASVIYGSDAIAGVVNVILRDRYEGAEANAYFGQFDEDDGVRQAYDFTIGSSSDRFSALFGASYVKEEPVMAGDRAISAVPVFGTGSDFGSSTTPNGRFALCPGVFTPGACSVGQTNPDGSAGQFTYAPGSGATNWRPFLIPEDIYNFAPDNYLLTPQERVSIFSRASANITDNIKFVATGTYNNRLSEQLLAAMPIVLGTGPGAGVQAQTIGISPDSMYNPFGQTVSRIQRRAVETGGRSFRQDVTTYAFSGGLEGAFEVGDRYFSWDAGMVYGKNSQSDTTYGLFNVAALRNALGPSMLVNGVPTCVATPGDPSTAIAGCVPLNLLGGVGSITQDMLDYSSFVAHDTLGYKMKQYYANISGDLFELPGGTVAFAAGIERREESGFDSPDALIASGNTTGNARTPTEGAYSVEEAYVELVVPVLKDVPFFNQLEFNLAGRSSDYSNFGDTFNSKFGFKWKPIESLLVRGNYSEGFRAPSIGELYQGVSDSFPQIVDPCNQASWANLSTAARGRCLAQNVPEGGYDQGNPQIRISVGGNPNLLPEKSKTKTLGMVWSPGFIEGFDASLDWFKITLKDGIDDLGGQAILNQCIRDGNAQACSLYTRNSVGEVATLLSAGLNFAEINVEGYDLTLNYRLPETSFGRFSFTWDTVYTSNYDRGDGDNLVGEFYDDDNHWRIRSNLMTRWELADFGATWSARFYSRQEEDCQFMVDYGYDLCSDPGNIGPDGPAAQNSLGGTTYHDVSFYWTSPWNARITVGANNVFSKTPPVSFSAFANSFDPAYDIPGRFYYMSYSQKF